MAESYSRKLSKIVLEGLKETARKGLTTGAPPFGFCSVDHKLAIDERTAPAVRLCFDSYAQGRTKTEIAEDLNARGYRTRKGTPFNIETVTRVLSNRVYIGENDYAGIERRCPSIIDEKTFATVQDLLAKSSFLRDFLINNAPIFVFKLAVNDSLSTFIKFLRAPSIPLSKTFPP